MCCYNFLTDAAGVEPVLALQVLYFVVQDFFRENVCALGKGIVYIQYHSGCIAD